MLKFVYRKRCQSVWNSNLSISAFNVIPEKTKPSSESSSPSLVVISRPPVNFTPQPVTIDLSKTSSVPLTLTNGSGSSVTVYNIDESQTSLNLSTESSGYVSNSTSSSLNQSAVNGDDLEIEKNISLLDQRLSTPVPSSFSALPMPPSVSNGRRRTISSNSNRWVRETILCVVWSTICGFILIAVLCGVRQLFGLGHVKFTTSLRKTVEHISRSVLRLWKSSCQLHQMRKRRQIYPS